MSTLETPEDLRRRFLIDPDVVYLNHGSFGACPRPVFDIFQAWQRQLERQPVEFVGTRVRPMLAAARSQIGAYLNAPPDAISFVDNATAGINVVARSLRLEPGDEVVATNLEYGALNNAWRYLCGKAGASYVITPITLPFTTADRIVDEIWASVTPRTRAVFVSHITSGTSTILPVAAICRRDRADGILTIVDGAHAPGQIPLDLTSLDVDFYAGNFHKWLCTPKGSAFLYAHPDHHSWVESLSIGWGWSEGHTFLTRNEGLGTRGYAEFLAVPRAIDFQAEHDWPTVRADCHERLGALRKRVQSRFGLDGISPDTSGWYAQMALIAVPFDDPVLLRRRLLHEHGIEAPCMKHGDQVYVRVSVQGYTTDAELAVLESALDALVS